MRLKVDLVDLTTKTMMLKNIEPVIKIHLIKWLEDRGMLDNAVLINELPVADVSRENFARRIDLSVANGKLLGFEIKSEFDNLDRLTGQVELYHKRFDKVFIVCTKKHTNKVLRMTNQAIGVIELSSVVDGVNFKYARRGISKNITSARALFSFVNKVDMLKFLKSKQARSADLKDAITRLDLYKLCDKYSTINQRRDFVIDTIKQNYLERYCAFKRSVKYCGHKTMTLRKLNSNPCKTKKSIQFISKEDEAWIHGVSLTNEPKPIALKKGWATNLNRQNHHPLPR